VDPKFNNNIVYQSYSPKRKSTICSIYDHFERVYKYVRTLILFAEAISQSSTLKIFLNNRLTKN